jgi:hypothetical protein
LRIKHCQEKGTRRPPGAFEDWETRSEGPPPRGQILDIYRECLFAARSVPETRLLPTLDIVATNEAPDPDIEIIGPGSRHYTQKPTNH